MTWPRLMRTLPFVVIAGPDGAGKSTVARALAVSIGSVYRFHWRPALLPHHRGSQDGSSQAARPHARRPHSVGVSALRVIYFAADYVVARLVWRVRPPGELILVERGWWDMAVDPRRYRLTVPPWLTRALGRLTPQPDMLIVLDAPADVLVRRKQELCLSELDRQRRAWLELTIPGAEKVVIDATKTPEQVVAAAREAIVSYLERRTEARAMWGWAALPRRSSPRFWLPRGPRSVAAKGVTIYQPVTPQGRVGWELARLGASIGGFRLLPLGPAPPREVRERLASILPPRSTYAVMRANHRGRWVALILREDGRPHAVAKVAVTPEGKVALAREARALRELPRELPAPLRAPGVLEEADGLLLLDAVDWQPRSRPWWLEPTVARALGAFWRQTGHAHGDVAPWNLLRADREWVLCDWEDAAACEVPGWDLWHWVCQAHALLGRPRHRAILEGLAGRGWVGEAVAAYAAGAGIDRDALCAGLAVYLERTLASLNASTPDGRRGLAARRMLLGEVRRT